MEHPFIKKIVSYFFRGLLFVAPIFITFLIIIKSLEWLDGLLTIEFPGLGLLILVTSITILGALTSTLLAKPVLELFNNLLEHIPVVNIIFKSLKDVVAAFVGDNKKFKSPVLFTLEKDLNIKRMGFITETNLTQLGEPDLVAVYVPDSYGITGNLYFVPKDQITTLDIPVAEAMKFILSGGVSGL